MKEAVLYKKEKNGKVRCLACAHKCLVNKGITGVCGVRRNVDGKLMLLVYGKVASMNVDPIEKKPLYLFMPRTTSFSVGTIGCNFRCDWCQNYDISQVSKEGIIIGKDVTKEKIVSEAIAAGCKSISYTYNDPIIFVEFVKDVAKLAHEKGLKNVMVTNGYWSKESFDYIADYIDAVNIDLKSFDDKFYNKYCGGKLQPVLDTIKRCHEKGIWVEITTLLIPGLNDDDENLEKIAMFIASLDDGVPWHISRFFPMYKMNNKPVTGMESLNRAYEIGKKYLKHVFLGNV